MSNTTDIYSILFIKHYPFPPQRGWHASCHKLSWSKRETKLKKKKKKKFPPLCPLSCRLSHKQTSALQGLHIAVATHNCGISPRSGVHPLDYAPWIPPHKLSLFTPIRDHFPWSLLAWYPNLFFFLYTLSSINPSLPWHTHWMTTSTLSYIDTLGYPIPLHPLDMAERLEHMFINFSPPC